MTAEGFVAYGGFVENSNQGDGQRPALRGHRISYLLATSFPIAVFAADKAVGHRLRLNRR